jgi:hypothetical protein
MTKEVSMKKNKGKIVVGLLGAVVVVVVLVALMTVKPAVAGNNNNGNGAPSGPHYTLNIIGVKEGHEKNMDPEDCGNGHRIFVKLGQAEDAKKGKSAQNARTKIGLISCEEMGYGQDCMDFAVLDCDGTDGDASLMLPDPNPGDGSYSTRYSVYVRALGKPGGKADVNVCAIYYDELMDEDIEYCGDVVELPRLKGQAKKTATASGGPGTQKFRDVSKELLTICVFICTDYNDVTEVCEDGEWERMYIFDERLRDEVWNYDNKGLKRAQIRFYPIPSYYTEGEWACP